MEIDPNVFTEERIKQEWCNTIGHKFSNINKRTKTEFSFIILKEDTVLISFMQSKQLLDWFQNFAFFCIPYRGMKKLFLTHWGFTRKYKSIRDQIHRMIKLFKPKKIKLRGFSQGGALAMLAHEDLKYNFPNINVSTIAFGSPTPFMLFNQSTLKERLHGLLRIEYEGDLVTYLPGTPLLYKHYGLKVRMGPKRFFAGIQGHSYYYKKLK